MLPPMPAPRLYPLHDLPHQDRIWAWISYDVANQSFTLLVNTLLFPLFFQDVVVAGHDRADTLWSLILAASMLFVVIASPIVGAIADDRSWKKESLIATGLACALLTCAFALIREGQILFAALLYIPANFLFSVGENFLAAFLPELSRREDMGRLSGFSWACAYFSALILLVITAIGMNVGDIKAPSQWRPFFVFAGVWFLVFMIPTALVLRERDRPVAHAGHSVWTVGFVRLAESLHQTRQFRDLVTLLIASLLYGAGMNVIIFFASILASEFGFEGEKLVIFVAVITVSGIVGTLIPTICQDRFGHKNTTVSLLVLWLFTALALAAFAWQFKRDPAHTPSWPLWLFGNLIGFGLGSLGSANRAFVGFLTPASRTAEVFGVWGMVFKLAAILTIPFAYVKDRLGTPASLCVLAFFILCGLIVTLFVDERRGLKAITEIEPPTGNMLHSP
jgi:UMF1 family MFS transporter